MPSQRTSKGVSRTVRVSGPLSTVTRITQTQSTVQRQIDIARDRQRRQEQVNHDLHGKFYSYICRLLRQIFDKFILGLSSESQRVIAELRGENAQSIDIDGSADIQGDDMEWEVTGASEEDDTFAHAARDIIGSR
jgi:hypothetical protein